MDAAFSGIGARDYPGRWNQRGVPVVYAAEAPSLSALEVAAHFRSRTPRLSFVSFEIRIPGGVEVHSLDPDQLPNDWRQEPPPSSTQELGTRLIRNAAVLRVPSAIVPVERNMVLNPDHPQFRQIRISGPEPFVFDSRMWK